MTRRRITVLNNPRNLNDNGTLRATGLPPADWYRAAAGITPWRRAANPGDGE